jgi:FlaA1/EpsC-like NDP-sugar epimerase
MGSPVSILDLARRFVTAHGLRAVEAGEESGGGGTPMPIEIVGARPGEKIHEELVHDPAALRATRADGLLAWSGEASDPVWTRRMTAAMARVRFSSDHAETLRALREWIPLPGAAGASEGVSGHADQAVRPSPPAHAA